MPNYPPAWAWQEAEWQKNKPDRPWFQRWLIKEVLIVMPVHAALNYVGWLAVGEPYGMVSYVLWCIGVTILACLAYWLIPNAWAERWWSGLKQLPHNCIYVLRAALAIVLLALAAVLMGVRWHAVRRWGHCVPDPDWGEWGHHKHRWLWLSEEVPGHGQTFRRRKHAGIPTK